MKIYSTIITIVAVLALCGVGYGYWAGLKFKSALTECQTQEDAYRSQIQKIQSDTAQKLAEISKLAEILRESSGSFIHAGDVKALSFNQSSLDKIHQGIKNIESEISQKMIEDKWNKFQQSCSLNDYRDFIGTIGESIKNETSSSQVKD